MGKTKDITGLKFGHLTLKIEYQNEIHSLMEWSRLLKIKYETLRARILKSGWSVEKAFNTPVNKEEV